MVCTVSTSPVVASTLTTKEPLRPSEDPCSIPACLWSVLKRITGLLHLQPSIHITVLERQFKGLAIMCGDQLQTWV